MKAESPRTASPESQPVPDRFLRVNQVLELFPVARSTWWKGVKDGLYPQGVKLSPRTTAWRMSEIQALIVRLSGGQ